MMQETEYILHESGDRSQATGGSNDLIGSGTGVM